MKVIQQSPENSKFAFKEVLRNGQVYLVAKQRRGRKRYSRRLRPMQELGRAAAQAQLQQAEGMANAFRVFADESDKSASRKRDGSMKDYMRNYTKSLEEYLDSTHKIPSRYLRAVSRSRALRGMKSLVF
jgi:hypothetical protein